MHRLGSWILLAALCGSAAAQADLAFEAASIKPSEAGKGLQWSGCQGGPGSNDPGRIECRHVTLRTLAAMAYAVKTQEVFGPSWMDDAYYDLVAKFPTGTKRDQTPAMFRSLLAERFKAEVHREKRAIPGYALTVGKNGLKIKETIPAAAADDTPAPDGPPQKGPDGFVKLRPGSFSGGTIILFNQGHAKLQGSDLTLAKLAGSLSRQLDRIVADESGVSGKFDVTLYWAPEGQEPGAQKRDVGVGASAEANVPSADIFQALEQQLGLKLSPKKVERDAVVVDRAERTPTEN